MKYCFIAVLVFVITICVLGKQFCEVGNRNWNLLDGPPWSARKSASAEIIYQISLCRPLEYDSLPGKDCNNSAVCVFRNGTAENIAVYSPYDITIDLRTVSKVSFEGLPCSQNQLHQTMFNFICDRHLNFPEVTTEMRCLSRFTWYTLAACKEISKRREVACYVYDEDGNMKDLTPLIKMKGGYSVSSTDIGVDFFINVCSGIIPDGETEGCPQGSAACRKIGSEFLSFGNLDTPVVSSNSTLKITYSSKNATIPAGCDIPPRTTITFKCPPKGRSSRPRLIDDSNCQYEIEWQTEHSCPKHLVTTDLASCKFTREQHNVDLDLSPLKNKSGYKIQDKNNRLFLLNVCGGLGEKACGKWKSVAACMDQTPIGYMSDASLSYLDGKVKLIYKSKGKCNNTEFPHRAIIEFQCDPNAGVGSPTFVDEEEDCDYIFNWVTKYACPKHPLSDKCYIDDGNIHIDLGLLIRNPSQKPWQVLNSVEANNSTYYLNICNGVSRNFSGSNCDSSAAVCKVGFNGSSFNYGKFISPPIYNRDSKIVTLVYMEGDSCGAGELKTNVNLICKPGALDSPPILESISDDGCYAVIRWHTAAACPQAIVKGSNCTVVDNDLGLKFDLNPLKNDTYYEVKADDFTYYLNVCGKVNGTKCDGIPGNMNAAACQEGATAIKIGEPNSELFYNDGMIKLTYSLGARYNDTRKTPRRTIITFLCDEKVGVGQPEFHKQTGPIYSFLWYTSYACPTKTAFECIARNLSSNEQYDLSRLTRGEGKISWEVIENTENRVKKFYLNICRPLTSTESRCPPNSAACLVETDLTTNSENVINIGEMVQPPEVNAGGPKLVYVNGDPCTSYGLNTTYSTVIQFICGKYDDEHFRFLRKVGNCRYVFLIQTSAACPIEDIKSENDCSIKDPVTGTVYNFTQFKETYYNVTAGDHRYQVSVCGAKSGGCNQSGKDNNVTVCEVDENGDVKKNISFLNGYSLQILDNVITLIYNGTYNESTGTTSKVYITFKCTKQQKNNLTFQQSVDSQYYYFELSTPTACSSDQEDCLFVGDDGNNYDLTPLLKRGSSNWEAVDNREGYTHWRYHINFCVPLNPSSRYKCPVGAIGACQTSTENKEEGLSLGFRQRPVIKENEIIISYTGGSPCNGGQYNRSAKVTLHCSQSQSELILLGVSETCVFYFYMYTPVACPLKDYVGSDCKVSVPGYNYHFDLSRLRHTKASNQYKVKHGEYIYILNVCGPVATDFSSCLKAGVCQTKPNDISYAVDAGKASSKLHYKDGVVELRYENGKGDCHRKYNRTTVITFLCNPGAKEDGPRFLSEDSECTYFFEWQTSLVCLEHEVQECSVSSDTKHYDLSILSSNTYNIALEEKQIAISICNRLSQSKYSNVCSLNSAACIVEYRNDTIVKGTNIGDIGTPYLENDILKLRYMHGDTCHLDKTTLLQTVIEFECDPKSPLDSKPTYGGNENCTYYFNWRHRAACPTEKEIPGDNCTAVNPVTGFTFDLSILRRETSYEVKSNDHKYRINVCGAVTDAKCKNKSGSCQEERDGERKWNMGNFNSKLHFHEGVLMLNYTGGDICHKIYNRATIIQFSCGIGTGHPTFVSESHDCTYLFSWSTVYACEDRVPCFASNGAETFDLTSLMLEKGHHTAVNTIDDNEYIINVCSPLSNPDPLCHDAGICRTGASAVNLGRPHGPPFIDFLGHVTVLYTDGTPCNGNNTNKGRIEFLCNFEAGRGVPTLSSKDEEQCIYIFTWRTSLVCPEKKPPSPTPPLSECKYIAANRGINIDLSPLRKINSSYEVKAKHDDKFTINICGPSEPGDSDCSTAGVCSHGMADKENFGSVDSTTFSYSDKELVLTYDNGGSCPLSDTGRRSSRILFTCVENAGNGFPTLFKKSACLATFKWKTNLVCVEKPPVCTFKKGDNFYDLRLLSSISHSWNISDNNGNLYWINVCKATNVDFGPGNCINSGICTKLSNGTFLSIGSLSSWNLDATDSEEVILTYQYFDQSCPEKTGTSIVKFICGKKMGAPKFKSGSVDSCKFEFVWESTEACAAVRKQILPMEDKAFYDPRLKQYFNMSALYNSTFTTEPSGQDGYVFVVNLSGVGPFGSRKECENAAVCQTKPETFYRDIGTVSTETFFLKGNELILELTSFGRKCGKNKDKNVTTVINFSCSSAAGLGSPIFYYESGNCDYLFEWDTDLVCPKSLIIPEPKNGSKPNISNGPAQTGKQSSSYIAKVMVGIILSASLVALIIIFAKEERRNAIRTKIRSAFANVQLPKMFYRRNYSETLLLSSPSTPCRSDSDVEILT